MGWETVADQFRQRRGILLLAGFLLSYFISQSGLAKTATSVMSANVDAACVIDTTGMNSGMVAVLTGTHIDADANADLIVECSNGTPWVATADAGQAQPLPRVPPPRR